VCVCVSIPFSIFILYLDESPNWEDKGT